MLFRSKTHSTSVSSRVTVVDDSEVKDKPTKETFYSISTDLISKLLDRYYGDNGSKALSSINLLIPLSSSLSKTTHSAPLPRPQCQHLVGESHRSSPQLAGGPHRRHHRSWTVICWYYSPSSPRPTLASVVTHPGGYTHISIEAFG